MGARGPRPLPANVHLLRGNPSKKALDELQDAVNPDVEIPGLPKHLLPEARKEWRRITPQLAKYRLVSALDRAALTLYVQDWAYLVWHEECLQRDIRLAETKRAEWEALPENAGQVWTGGDGLQIPTPNGNFTYNPHWVARNKAAERVSKSLAHFGLSPSSRGRVAPSSGQIPLELDDEAPKEGFNAF